MKHLMRWIGVIILIFILTRIDFNRLLNILFTVDIVPFILINLLIIPGVFLKSMRWRYLLKLQGIDYGIRDSFFSYMAGIFAGVVTPAKVGEAVKAVYLKQEKDVPYHQGLASITADRFFDLYMLVVLALTGMAFWAPMKARWHPLLVLFLFFCFPLLILNKSFFKKAAGFFYRFLFAKADKKLFEGQFKLFLCALSVFVSPRVFKALWYSLVIYFIYFLQCYFLSRLIGLKFSYLEITAIVSVTTLIALIPVTVLGIGTRDMGMIYFFVLYGANKEQAVAYSFLLLFSYFFSGVITFGGWFLKWQRLNEDNIHRGFGKPYAIFINLFSRLSYILFSGGKNFSELLLEPVKFNPKARVLDIGCGVGNLISDIDRRTKEMGISCRIIGIDRSFEMIKIAGKKTGAAGKAWYLVADAARMPFKEKVFDITFNALLLHHLPVQLKKDVIGETFRTAQYDAQVVLMDIDCPSSFFGWLIALSRWHIPAIRSNCRMGLANIFSLAGFRKERQIKRLGLFSYYLLRKEQLK